MSESDAPRTTEGRKLQGEVLQLDFDRQGKSLLEEARRAAQGRAARTLVKDGALRLTLLAMKADAVIPEHRAGGPLSIHAISGSAIIGIGSETHELGEDGALVLEANVTHSVEATSDLLILLTIVMTA